MCSPSNLQRYMSEGFMKLSLEEGFKKSSMKFWKKLKINQSINDGCKFNFSVTWIAVARYLTIQIYFILILKSWIFIFFCGFTKFTFPAVLIIGPFHLLSKISVVVNSTHVTLIYIKQNLRNSILNLNDLVHK